MKPLRTSGLPEYADLPPGVIAASNAALNDMAMNASLKAIYGDQFNLFMGIRNAQTGIEEIQNSPSDYNRAYTAESIIHRLVNIRGNAICQVPLRVYSVAPNGKRTPVDHDAMAVIHYGNPQNWVAGENQTERYTLASLDLQGRVAWQLAFNGKKQPTEIYWLPPGGWEPFGNDAGYFAGIKIKTAGNAPPIRANQLFYHHTLNMVHPWEGTSKIMAARGHINLNLYSVMANTSFMKNGMQGASIITGDWDNTQDNENFIQRLLKRYRGAGNAGKTLVIGKNTKVVPMSVNPRDAEWVNQQKLSLEALCAIFGVPLPIYGNLDKGTYQNYDQAAITFWDNIGSDLEDLADGLTRGFLSYWEDVRRHNLVFGWDYSQVRGLNEDVNKIWERFMAYYDRVQKQVADRMLTPNKARIQIAAMAEQLGLDPTPWQGEVPGGNTFYIPYQEIPIEEARLQGVIDVMAARGPNPQLEEDVPGARHAGDNAAKPSPDASKAFVAKAVPHPIPIRDNRLAPIQEKLARRLKRFFQDQQTTALRSLRNGGKANDPTQPETPPPGAAGGAGGAAPVIGAALWNQNDAVAALEGIIRAGVDETVAAAFVAAKEDFGVGGGPDPNHPFLSVYMGSRLGRIKGIDDTTRNQINEALAKGYQAGDSMDQLAERVKGVYRNAIDNRALMIARTETIQAYGLASLAAYGDAGIEKAQMYDGPNADSADCDEVNGQIVTLAEAAQLMGEEHPNGTRGVAPYFEIAQPATVAASFDPLAVLAEAIAKLAARPLPENHLHIDRGAIQAGEVKVAAAPAPNVIIEEGAVKVNVEPAQLNVQAGAIQSTTHVQSAPEGDVEIEWSNLGETGKPTRLRRRR